MFSWQMRGNTLGNLLKLATHQLNMPVTVKFVCRYNRPKVL
jgi:hypothetical protein